MHPSHSSLHSLFFLPLVQGSEFVGNVLVDPTAKIGAGCLIGPDVSIGAGCTIGNGVRLSNCVIMRGVSIKDHTKVGARELHAGVRPVRDSVWCVHTCEIPYLCMGCGFPGVALMAGTMQASALHRACHSFLRRVLTAAAPPLPLSPGGPLHRGLELKDRRMEPHGELLRAGRGRAVQGGPHYMMHSLRQNARDVQGVFKPSPLALHALQVWCGAGMLPPVCSLTLQLLRMYLNCPSCSILLTCMYCRMSCT